MAVAPSPCVCAPCGAGASAQELAGASAAVAAPENRQPHGIGAVVQQPSCAAAAGWQSLCEAGVGEEEAEEEEGPAEADAAGGAKLGDGLSVDAEGCLPFYFLDAYESADARAGRGRVGF